MKKKANQPEPVKTVLEIDPHHPHIHADLKSYRETFLGDHFGIGLRPRAKWDRHVVIDLLIEVTINSKPSEHESRWFLAQGQNIDSMWMPDICASLNEASEWLTRYATSDGNGWKFLAKTQKRKA